MFTETRGLGDEGGPTSIATRGAVGTGEAAPAAADRGHHRGDHRVLTRRSCRPVRGSGFDGQHLG